MTGGVHRRNSCLALWSSTAYRNYAASLAAGSPSSEAGMPHLPLAED